LMRQILVDHARTHKSSKRGAELKRISLSDARVADNPEMQPTVLALDEALTRLADFDERKARVIEMRAFGGMSVEDTAEALSVSEPTVKRDMRFAQAWLRRELQLPIFALLLISKFLLIATNHLEIFSPTAL